MNLADPPFSDLTPQPAAAVRELGDSPALPRIDARLRAALDRLHDGRAIAWSLPWRDGRLALHWLHDEAPPPCDAYRFRLGAWTGQVALDRPAQAALAGEPRLDRVPQALRAILLAEAAQAWVEALEQSTRLRFEWLAGDDAVPFDVQRAAGFRLGDHWRGAVQFDEPGALDALVPPVSGRGRGGDGVLARLRFPLRLRLGETRIRLREVRGIETGDIVSIEDWRPAGAAVVVTATAGGAAGLEVTGHAEGSRITIQDIRDATTMNRSPDDAPTVPGAHDTAELAIDRLDSLEVTLRFEVGELQLSLGDLRNLRPGQVLDLGQPLNRSPVRIVAHGNLLGKGTLVAVGDRLGVRVSEIAAGEL